MMFLPKSKPENNYKNNKSKEMSRDVETEAQDTNLGQERERNL